MNSIIVKPFKVLDTMKLMEESLKYLGFRFSRKQEQEKIISMIPATANYFPVLIQIKRILGDPEFREEIKRNFEITLEGDNDRYYYLIALIFAYLYYNQNSIGGCSLEEIMGVMKGYGIQKTRAAHRRQHCGAARGYVRSRHSPSEKILSAIRAKHSARSSEKKFGVRDRIMSSIPTMITSSSASGRRKSNWCFR